MFPVIYHTHADTDTSVISYYWLMTLATPNIIQPLVLSNKSNNSNCFTVSLRITSVLGDFAAYSLCPDFHTADLGFSGFRVQSDV